MNISQLKLGQRAKVLSIGGEGRLRSHLLDMGIVPGVAVVLEKRAPLGDPLEIKLRGYCLSLRESEASMIEVELPLDESSQIADNLQDKSQENLLEDNCEFGYHIFEQSENSHPGIGEEGKYHRHEDEINALPKGTVMRFALVGQQNCGKTSVFNVLTGANQHVGNFPGVTVDRKDGPIKGHPNTLVTDLPGIYSLSPYTEEEVVTRRFILEEKPHCIINVVDATNIERNLYLTLQLLDLNIPIVLVLNMMDEARNNGMSIRINEMENTLGIPVLPVSALKNEGVQELVEHAIHIAKYQECPVHADLCDAADNGGGVHRCVHGIKHLIEDHAQRAGIPPHFAATKITEGDQLMLSALHLTDSEKTMVESIICQMEEERGMDRAAAIADMRFGYIDKLCRRTVVKPTESKEYRRSMRIDKVLTGKWTSLPIFVLIMSLIIWLSIDVLGAPLQDVLDEGISWLGGEIDLFLSGLGVDETLRALISDGVFAGVGSVVSFLPILVILFFFLSMLEDSGYMARVAFVTDRLLRHLGLSGRSIVPLLLGFGCSVPAVMSSRTLPSAHDRRMTVMLIPFVSCSAKIPLYAFLSSAFFPGHGGLVLVCLYLTGIFAGIVVAFANKYIGTRTQASPFVLELPNYRLPALRNVAQLLWEKTKDFLQKAFTVIFVGTLVIWVLQTFSFRFSIVENGEGSMLAWIAGILAPVLQPVGLGDWRIVTSLISGITAKESVVATMQVLDVTSVLTTASAFSMLVFSLLYSPCIATIASVKREMGGKYAVIMVVFQCVVAWLAALLAYNIGQMIF